MELLQWERRSCITKESTVGLNPCQFHMATGQSEHIGSPHLIYANMARDLGEAFTNDYDVTPFTFEWSSSKAV